MQNIYCKILFAIGLCVGGAHVQAQHFTIASNQASATCGNQHVSFEAGFIEVGTTYGFNSGRMPDDWSSSPYNLGQACSGIFADTPDGSEYFWATINDANGYRFVSTNALNMQVGGQITFSMRFGRDDPSSGCENPDEPSEGVYLQYSTDGGTQWTTMKYWVPYQIGTLSPEGIDLYQWNEFSVVVPAEAKTPQTKFRWFQPSNSGSSYDNWGLDDISVYVLREAQSYAWDIRDGNIYTEQLLTADFESDGVYTISCTVVDSEGDTYTSALEYEVIVDDEAPEARAGNYFLVLDEEGKASLIADYLNGGSTDNCSEINFSVDRESFDCSDLGDNEVSLTVSDNAGNASKISAIVSIYDFTPPTIITKDISIQLDREGKASVSPEQIDDGSNDACSGTLTLNLSKTEFTEDDLGENTVILRVSDESGNESTATATITVEDVTAPSGYTVAFERSMINAEAQSHVAFMINNAEIASTYEYTISSEGGVSLMDGKGQIEFSTQKVTDIDVSKLADGELRLSLTLTDESGNIGEVVEALAIKETSMPLVEITSEVSALTHNACSVTISFSEPVSDFSLDDIVLTNATVSHLQTEDQRYYTVKVHPVADGEVAMAIAAGTVMDEAGNSNLASQTLSFIYDGTAPEVNLSTEASLVNTDFRIHIAFDEEIRDFTAEDIQLNNAKVTDLKSEDAQNFEALISPDKDGEVSIQIAAGVAEDMAGNVNLASSEIKIVYDTTPPADYGFQQPIQAIHVENVYSYTIKLKDLEIGSSLYYSIHTTHEKESSVEGNLVVENGLMQISDLNLLNLADGTIEVSFYLVDAAGNQGTVVKTHTTKATVDIMAVESFSNRVVPFATAFEALKLPEKVEVSCSNGAKEKLEVEWLKGDYDPLEAGAYLLTGNIMLEACTNTQNFKTQLLLEVEKNLAPTQIILNSATFSPASPSDQAIGKFSTVDDDDRQHQYALVFGEGDQHNDMFTIVGDALYLKSNQGLSGQNRFSIRVRSSDAYSNAIEEVFTLTKSAYDDVESINFVNTFSPNGDGINEVWLVPDLKYFNDVSIEVFDRAGRSVFQSSDPERGWDGRVQGSIHEGGYYYIIIIHDIQLTKRGVLSVIK